MYPYRYLSEEVLKIHNRIFNYRHLFFQTPYPWQKMYYIDILCNELMQLNNLLWQIENHVIQRNKNPFPQENNQKTFTPEELSQFDGKNGKPAYVAVNGKVYDVSFEATWGGGTHFGLIAGTDVTEQFKNCHHNEKILEKLPIVGVLKKNESMSNDRV